MKTTFKKTMAALSAAAVVAASAAVMATPVSAAAPSGTVTVATVTVTLEELQANDYKVAVPITVEGLTGGWTGLQVNTILGSGLTYKAPIKNDCGAPVLAPAWDGVENLWLAATTDTAIDYPEFATITVVVSEDAQPGDFYSINASNVAPSGAAADFKNGNEDGTYTTVNGGVQIAEIPTEPETQPETQPETDAPTNAPATDAPTAAPTATATKAPAKSTSSPKTGDALPIAGVAAAVAVIGGVALVSKKRK